MDKNKKQQCPYCKIPGTYNEHLKLESKLQDAIIAWGDGGDHKSWNKIMKAVMEYHKFLNNKKRRQL